MGIIADENAAFAPPVTFSKQIKTAKKLVRELQSEKCDLIICLSHSGVEKEKTGNWAGEDANLASKVSGIDVIISGHTHTKLDKPLIVNGVPIVQAGEYGKYVGKLDLALNNGTATATGYELIAVDDRILGDRKVQELIDDQKKNVTETILKSLDLTYAGKVAENDFSVECNEGGDYENSNLGPLVADAIHSYINTHTKSGTDVSMVAVGVVRDNVLPGIQSAPDIFRIMSMGSGSDNIPGYPLAKLYVTGKELKSIMEILLVSAKSTPGNYCYYSGLKAEYDPGKGLLKKITKIQIVNSDGALRDVDFSKKNKELFSITANSYMLQFIGIIKKMSFGLINVVPKDASGQLVKDIKTSIIDMDEGKTGIQEGKEWLAIMEYVKAMKDLNNNGIPDIDPAYKSPEKNLIPISAGK
jgi:5'-nucleotidase